MNMTKLEKEYFNALEQYKLAKNELNNIKELLIKEEYDKHQINNIIRNSKEFDYYNLYLTQLATCEKRLNSVRSLQVN